MFHNIRGAEVGVVALWTLALATFCTAAYMAAYLDHERAPEFIALTCTLAVALYIAGNQLMLLDRIGQPASGTLDPIALQPAVGDPLAWLDPPDRAAVMRDIARRYVASRLPLPSSDESAGPEASNVRRLPGGWGRGPTRYSA